jgi:hypothetical protein
MAKNDNEDGSIICLKKQKFYSYAPEILAEAKWPRPG